MADGMSGTKLTFGIYPGGGTGRAEPGGPDRPDLVNQALDELQGTAGGQPDLDGAYPWVTEALVAGVRTARQAAERRGLDVKVGCNSTPVFGLSAGFFTDLTRAGGKQFVADLDYIGLDFFPDVFRPLAIDRMEDVVQNLLGAHRRDILVPAGLGHLPLVVTEHGWPTGPAGQQNARPRCCARSSA